MIGSLPDPVPKMSQVTGSSPPALVVMEHNETGTLVNSGLLPLPSRVKISTKVSRFEDHHRSYEREVTETKGFNSRNNDV